MARKLTLTAVFMLSLLTLGIMPIIKAFAGGGSW